MEKIKERKSILKEKLRSLTTTNIYYKKAFGERIINVKGREVAIHYSKEIAKWDFDDLDDLEQKVLKLEAAKKEIDDEKKLELPIVNRKKEYREIDEKLLEALAEKEEGRPEKMVQYLKLRKSIKEKYPKV